MRVTLPRYYHDFHCLAGACPHTCCAGWEVVLDQDTARYYQSLPGPLGEELRGVMVLEEGEWCLPLAGERCPFLDREGLCRIHRALGAEATSVTCRSHPRFVEEYGSRGQVALAISCPEAARLLLEEPGPLAFLEEEDGEETEELDPWDCRARDALWTAWETAQGVLAGEEPLAVRLAMVLVLAGQLQSPLAAGDWESMEETCALWRRQDFPAAFEDYLAQRPPAAPADLGAVAGFLSTLEVLEESWPPLLAACESALPHLSREDYAAALGEGTEEYGRLMGYFLSRYFLQAVWDLEVLSKVKLCLGLTAVLGALGAADWRARGETTSAARQDLASRLSREIEHSQENLAGLEEYLDHIPTEAWLELLLPKGQGDSRG